jgi:YHS domain-containing protein
MKTSMLCLLTICCFAVSAQEVRVKNFNLDGDLALQGYDPVSYFDGRAEEGKRQISYKHLGVTYYFKDSENRRKFMQTPEKYEPAYGGWCAYAMGETGEKVKVDPETFKIINGKIYLFYNFWTNNTLEDWNKDEQKLRAAADNHWKKYSNR